MTTAAAALVSAPRSAPQARTVLDRLLVATDYSTASRRALLLATRILAPGGRIRLVHVLDPGPYDVAALLLAVRKRATDWLEAEAESARRRGVECEARLVFGAPHERIAREGDSFRASAIVCGTHSRRGLERVLLGSVTERLLHRTSRPVLAVPHVRLARKVRRVLVPTDFSPTSTRALAIAEALCRARGSELVVHHVVDTVFPTAYAFATHPGFFEETRRRRKEAVARLRALRDHLSRAGTGVSARLDSGIPQERILRLARGEKIDLLVMGTRGLSRFERVFVGSVASFVLRDAPCPVLVVPPAGRSEGARGGKR